MTKQEEIMQGVKPILKELRNEAELLGRVNINPHLDKLLAYLHSQGVVIKIDRELPDDLMEGQASFDKQTYTVMLKQSGYEAVEPLRLKV